MSQKIFCEECDNVLSKLKSANKKTDKFTLNNLIKICKVVDVYDGDTCRVVFNHNGEINKWNIRMNGYDTPEIRPSKKLENRLEPFELPYSENSNQDHYLEAANQWFYNVKMMNAVAIANGAKYFVFLQPTMGLKDYQIPKDKKSSDYEIYKNVGGKNFDYFKDINALYDELKLKCSQLEFCFDISNLAPPTDNFYNDFRHHNQNGNKIIAEHIYKLVFQEPL